MYSTMMMAAVAHERMDRAVEDAAARRLRRALRGSVRANAARQLVWAAHRLDPEVDARIADVDPFVYTRGASDHRAA